MVKMTGAGVAAAAVILFAAMGDTIRYVPVDVRDTPWLQRLAAAQVKAAAGLAAFHDFTFTDRVAESGISFKSHIVDDAGKAYKAAQAKDQDQMIDIAETLSAACAGCHRKWRDRRTPANRCK